MSEPATSLARTLTIGDRSRRSSPRMRPAFDRLRAVTLNRDATLRELVVALYACHEEVTDRWRHTEGDVYAAAQRRHLMMTGHVWTQP